MPKRQTIRNRIIATLGPATEKLEQVIALAQAGVNVFRINMSHATVEEASRRMQHIRKAEKVVGRPLVAMGDLAGPKIRIGTIADGTTLQVGEAVEIVAKNVLGTKQRFSVNHPAILKAIKPGGLMYVGDGDIELEAVRQTRDGVLARVRVGGALKSKKGFVAHGMPVLKFNVSSKDKEHIVALSKAGIDAFAISFVQTAKDVTAVRKLIPKKANPFLVAKIETPAGLANAEAIMQEADALMVARGDLGFAMPLAELPHAQKELINLALRYGKPVITATQMLESMTERPVPTRAEVNDVANAILDGSDAVMLSAETASGRFPIKAVEMLASISAETAQFVDARDFPLDTVQDAVSSSVVTLADELDAKFIAVLTESGTTARHIARHRPQQTVIALTPREQTMRELQFSWGIHAVKTKELKSLEEGIAVARAWAKKNNVVKLKRGDVFILSAGLPMGQQGSTNMALVQTL